MAHRITSAHGVGSRNDSAKTRAAILAAAERTFARDGLAGARTDDIAAGAGVNKALLYYYFKSKEPLYLAVLEDHFKSFNGQALAVLAGPGSAQEVLLRYVSLHLDFISARHRHAPLFQQFMSAGGKQSANWFANILHLEVWLLEPSWSAACASGNSAGPTDFIPRLPSWLDRILLFRGTGAALARSCGRICDAKPETPQARGAHVHPARFVRRS